MATKIHVVCNRFPKPYVYSHQIKSVHFFKQKKTKKQNGKKYLNKMNHSLLLSFYNYALTVSANGDFSTVVLPAAFDNVQSLAKDERVLIAQQLVSAQCCNRSAS